MKILITGTAGFIGFHLAEKLHSTGHEVLGIDNINNYYDVKLKIDRLKCSGFNEGVLNYGKQCISNKYQNLRFIRTELEDRESIFHHFNSFHPEIVINLAAQAGVRYSLSNPDTYIRSNIQGFLNILEACRAMPVKHLIYASSSSVYGLNHKMPFSVHHQTDHPVSLYAASKKSNELMAHTYSHLFDIPSTGLRFFTVYGPWGRPDMALFIFTKSILKGEPIDVFNQGNMERDFTYIDDITEGICRMISHPPLLEKSNSKKDHHENGYISSAPSRLYNIGNGAPVRLMDFISAIEKRTGKKAEIRLMPMQPGDVEKTWADTRELKTDFDYSPYTPVQEGINRFIDWYEEYYGIPN